MQQNLLTRSDELLSIHSLSLPHPQSHSHEPHIMLAEDRLVLGYLTHDPYCESPMYFDDGFGSIYDSRRHSDTHSDMQRTLGLDSNWEPELSLVDDFPEMFRLAWLSSATKSPEFQIWAEATAGARAVFCERYYRRRAAKLWSETYMQWVPMSDKSIDDFEFTDQVRIGLWRQLRDERLIGDPNFVLLDCYQHSGVAWSVSGTGMQCPWDTARGAGVWVPSEHMISEIDRRAQVYAFGCVIDNGKWIRSGNKRFFAKLNDTYGAGVSPPYENWEEAFNWLEQRSACMKLPSRKREREEALLAGRLIALEEVAKTELHSFNSWLNGDNYGVVIAEYRNTGDATNPNWEAIFDESSFGYIGAEYAYDVLTSEFNAYIASKQTASSPLGHVE